MGDASRPAAEPPRFAEFERWRGFVPLLCALGLLAFDVVYAAITIDEFVHPFRRGHWEIFIVLADQQFTLVTVGVVAALVLFAALAATRRPVIAYFLGFLFALGTLLVNVIAVIAEFGNYAPMTRRSWTLTTYYGGATVLALALATGLFWALIAPAARAPGVTAS